MCLTFRRGRGAADMKIDPEASDSRVAHKRLLEQIVATPAILYFPTGIAAELNEICENLGYSPVNLSLRLLKARSIIGTSSTNT